MRGVYIHIPFCRNICSYCDFCKMYYNKELSNIYLDYLEKEIDMYYEGDTVKTIYVGGGTPSSLDTDNLNKLFRIINKFKIKIKDNRVKIINYLLTISSVLTCLKSSRIFASKEVLSI